MYKSITLRFLLHRQDLTSSNTGQFVRSGRRNKAKLQYRTSMNVVETSLKEEFPTMRYQW